MTTRKQPSPKVIRYIIIRVSKIGDEVYRTHSWLNTHNNTNRLKRTVKLIRNVAAKTSIRKSMRSTCFCEKNLYWIRALLVSRAECSTFQDDVLDSDSPSVGLLRLRFAIRRENLGNRFENIRTGAKKVVLQSQSAEQKKH